MSVYSRAFCTKTLQSSQCSSTLLSVLPMLWHPTGSRVTLCFIIATHELCFCSAQTSCLCKAFPTRGNCSACSSGDGSSLSSGLAALAQPFKLRLARSEHEQQLKDYSSNVVLIEPLASMTAVEDFLWSKVYRSEHSPPPPARAASAAAAAAGTVSFPQPCLAPVL